MLGSPTPKAHRVAGDIAVLILQQAIGSSTHLIAQHALQTLTPAAALFWRGLFAATVALGWLLWRNHLHRMGSLLSGAEYRRLLLLGLLAVPLNQWCFFTGVRLTAAANASLFYALTPVWTLALSYFLGQEGLSGRKLLGIGLALLGVGSVLAEKELAFGTTHLTGNLLLLSASLAWAAFTVLSQPFSLRYGAIPTTAVSMVIGWLSYLPLWLALGAPLQLEYMNPPLWGELVYMGVVTSGIGYLLWLLPLRHLATSKVAIFSTLQPVFTTLAAIPLFGFVLTPGFLLGGALIALGVIVTQLG